MLATKIKIIHKIYQKLQIKIRLKIHLLITKKSKISKNKLNL